MAGIEPTGRRPSRLGLPASHLRVTDTPQSCPGMTASVAAAAPNLTPSHPDERTPFPLMVRSPPKPQRRLSVSSHESPGFPCHLSLAFILRDASLRDAPQDGGGGLSLTRRACTIIIAWLFPTKNDTQRRAQTAALESTPCFNQNRKRKL